MSGQWFGKTRMFDGGSDFEGERLYFDWTEETYEEFESLIKLMITKNWQSHSHYKEEDAWEDIQAIIKKETE